MVLKLERTLYIATLVTVARARAHACACYQYRKTTIEASWRCGNSYTWYTVPG